MKTFCITAEKLGEEEVRCGHCNCRVTRLFVLAETEEDAINIIKEDGGLCGECFAEMLAEGGYKVDA